MQKGFAPIIILVGILVITLVAGGAYYFLKLKTPEQKACIMDVKICPDGSSVGRSGPNCEFARCPTPKPSPSSTPSDETSNWKTYTNKIKGYLIKYPNEWQVSEDILTSDFSSSPYTSIVKGKLDVQATVNIFVEKKTTPASFLPSEILKEFKFKETTFNSYQAVVAISSGFNTQKWIFINNDSKAYVLNTWGAEEDQEEINQILSTFKFLSTTADRDQNNAEGKFCGDIAGNLPENQCPAGYKCQLDGNYPDASGKCVKL